MAHFVFRGCRRCDGDLILESGDWRCLQFGRYRYYRRPLPPSTGEFWAFWRRRSGAGSRDGASQHRRRWTNLAGEGAS